jgi:ZIP family zinc transporter
MVAIVEEILPQAHQTQDTNLSTLTFIGSFALSIYFE